MSIFELCDVIRQTGFDLHKYLRHGHLEKVYENGLVHRLRAAGLQVRPQYPITVYDIDGVVLGDFYADLYVEERLIVEIKACRSIVDEHVAQMLGYLRASRIEHGLLINFGAPSFQVKKLVLSQDHE